MIVFMWRGGGGNENDCKKKEKIFALDILLLGKYTSSDGLYLLAIDKRSSLDFSILSLSCTERYVSDSSC